MSKINKLLDAISDFEVVVPEFQREYVWTLEQSKELITSLFNNYPTGSILVWETNNPPEIKKDALKTHQAGWVKVLLDGQQRLTTLFLFARGEIPPYYSENDITYDPRHLYFNLHTAEFNYYQKQKMADNPYWVQVTECFSEQVDAFVLVESLSITDPSEKLKIGGVVNKNLNRLRSILEIEYFVQTVPPGVDIDKAIDIFDLVNSQGTKLTDAELVLTHISGKWPWARRNIKQEIARYEQSEFYFDLDFMTRCVVVVLNKSALYKKMTDDVYARLTEDDYIEAWGKVVKAFDYLIPILKQSANLSGSKDLNTNNVFVPMLAYLTEFGSFTHTVKNNFIRWMYLASIWGRYSGQTDQKLDRDVYIAVNETDPLSGLLSEIEDQRGRLEVKPSDLEGRGASHPLHRMLYIIARNNKATDWANGGSITDTLGDYYSIQSHHVFPQACLYRNGFSSENHLDKKKVNEVANRAFITRDANYNISDKSPSEYLPKIFEKYPEALSQQLIPSEPSLWELENYDSFLSIRRKMIADSINSFLDSFSKSEEEPEVDYKRIIAKGEDDYTEFKSSLRWDYRAGIINNDLEFTIAKTVSSFMNTEGGKVFIGVSDSGEIVGLENDIKTFNKQNKDSFLLRLTQVINNHIGKEFNQFTSYRIVELDSIEVCVITVTKSATPAFIKGKSDSEQFFARSSASTQNLSIREANEYIKNHWS